MYHQARRDIAVATKYVVIVCWALTAFLPWAKNTIRLID